MELILRAAPGRGGASTRADLPLGLTCTGERDNQGGPAGLGGGVRRHRPPDTSPRGDDVPMPRTANTRQAPDSISMQLKSPGPRTIDVFIHHGRVATCPCRRDRRCGFRAAGHLRAFDGRPRRADNRLKNPGTYKLSRVCADRADGGALGSQGAGRYLGGTEHPGPHTTPRPAAGSWLAGRHSDRSRWGRYVPRGTVATGTVPGGLRRSRRRPATSYATRIRPLLLPRAHARPHRVARGATRRAARPDESLFPNNRSTPCRATSIGRQLDCLTSAEHGRDRLREPYHSNAPTDQHRSDGTGARPNAGRDTNSPSAELPLPCVTKGPASCRRLCAGQPSEASLGHALLPVRSPIATRWSSTCRRSPTSQYLCICRARSSPPPAISRKRRSCRSARSLTSGSSSRHRRARRTGDGRYRRARRLFDRCQHFDS